MEMIVDFPGGAKVDVHFGEFTVKTDQSPQNGGEASAPSPFSLFLASLGACAGIYVLGFCQQRGIPSDGVRIVQRTHKDESNDMVKQIDIEIQTPPGFPEKYLPALVRSANQCAIKKHLEKPPKFNVYTQKV